ncbi:MAG: hypothetical protein HY720_07840 [Planctomycetes bacterium]|nr:hypothetical protein [Planctomycetota bacterium]
MSGLPYVQIVDDRRAPVRESELGSLQPVRILPGRPYGLRLYRRKEEPERTWTPIHRDDLVVFEVARGEALKGEGPPPRADLRVLCRIRFQADNDGWFPKMVRWGFRAEEGDGSQRTSRIPLRVLPRFARQMWTILGLVFVIALSNILEKAVAWGEGILGSMSFLKSVVYSIVAGFLLFLVLLGLTRALQTFASSRE